MCSSGCAAPSPEGDLAGGKPATPRRKGKATTGGRQPATTDSDVDVARIVELYQADHSAPQIAKTIGGITPRRVRAILERNGIPLRDDRRGRSRPGARDQIDDTTITAMVVDYEAGATLRDLANSYGHRIGVIRDRLADAGVTIRKAASVASVASAVGDATEWATIRTGYAEGISLDVLAHRHHLRISRIRDHLTEHGIHIRDKGEAAQALVDRIRAHGLDQHAVKTWALEQGMITKISRGNINGRALEAYIAAHPTTTTEENPA